MKLLKNLYGDFILVFLIFLYNYSKTRWGLLDIIGFIIIVTFCPFWLLARVQLGKYFTIKPEAKGLVTNGLYSKFRNPIYLFSSLSLLGAILPAKNLFQYIIYILFLAIQIIRAKKEEKLLLEKFGKKYIIYKSQTWV